MIDDGNWLSNLSPEEATNAMLMIWAHADEDLFDKAFSNICVYRDKMEEQQAEGK